MNIYTEKRQELFEYFEDCVKRHFAFLENMSFSVEKHTLGWRVTYSSDTVELNVYYERVSFEIDLTISLKGIASCSIDEISSHYCKRKFLSAVDKNTVECAVIELKTLTNCYGMPYLRGDVSTFEKILKRREENTVKYNFELVECKAIKAWESGNYNKVIELYQPLETVLTPIQKKRLQLSQRYVENKST